MERLFSEFDRRVPQDFRATVVEHHRGVGGDLQRRQVALEMSFANRFADPLPVRCWTKPFRTERARRSVGLGSSGVSPHRRAGVEGEIRPRW